MPTSAREKSPRKLTGATTVAQGLNAAPAAAAASTRSLAVPSDTTTTNSGRQLKQRVAQSSPNLMRNAERGAWTCPSCEYAHNTTSICAVCAANRPGSTVATSPPIRVPRAPAAVAAAASSPVPAATTPNRSPRPRRLDSAIQEVLGRLELASYADTFVENEIDHAALLLLTETDLKDLGITALGPRRKLLAYIQDPQFQPYKPGYGTSDSLPPSVPGTMEVPAVPRPNNELFRSSGGSTYERAPPPSGEYGHVLVVPQSSGSISPGRGSPYGELPQLSQQRPIVAPYNPISQAQIPENDSDDSGNASDGDGVYGVLPDVGRRQ